MKAVYYETFGAAADALILGDVDDPTPGPGEVLVRIKTSGVNPSDVKLRAGKRPGGLAPEMPFPRIVPHSDGAGVIAAVGAGVPESRLGERVWIWNGQWGRPFGTGAELIAVPSDQAPALPEPASFIDGACLGIPAMTAHAALFSDGALAGQTVMVTGAAGTVGRYAVQMARLAGATVIATVSGPAKAAEAEAAGAHHIVNYRTEDVAERALEITGGAGVHRIVEVEFGGNLQTTARAIAVGGVVAAYASMADPEPRLPFYPLMFKNVCLRLVVTYQLDAAARRRAVEDISAWLGAGALSHRVAETRPLAEAAAAHERVEAGDKIGCVILEV